MNCSRPINYDSKTVDHIFQITSTDTKATSIDQRYMLTPFLRLGYRYPTISSSIIFRA